MDHAEHLERNAVGAAHENRQRFSAGNTDEPGGGRAPFGIADVSGAEVEMRNLSGGEDQQQSPAFHVGNGLFEGTSVGDAAFGTVEGVEEDAHTGQFGEIAEHVVGEDANVGADAGEEGGEECAIEQAEGVVGNGDDGAGGRDFAEVVGGDFQFDVEGSQEVAAKQTCGPGIEIQTFEFIDL